MTTALGRLRAQDAYAKGEILASWDERFRPVNMLGGPDGTLYVVDMYRGIVQEQIYWTDFLKEYITARDLEKPVHLGRIWRIVHESTKPERKPALSKAKPAELVQTLSHPNGWWRDTAQRILVERGDSSVVPQLKQLASGKADWRATLHALWTLDGLDAIEPDTVRAAFASRSAEVRAAAVRISERWIGQADSALADAVLKLLDDPSWTVRRQVAATIGELPASRRLDAAVAALSRYSADPIVVDVTISGLRGREGEILGRLVAGKATAADADAVAMLSAAVAKSGEVADVQRILAWIGDTAGAPWRRTALLQGLDLGLPGTTGGRGGRGGGRGAIAPPRPVSLPTEPTVLTQLAASTADGEHAALAKKVVSRFEWPGKPTPVVEVTPLTPEEQKRFGAGAEIYKNLCVACHQPDGRGKEKLAPSLLESRYTTGDPGAPVRILLAGKEGTVGLMPPLGGTLNDEQIASVLTYVRREWGNTGSPVDPEDVAETRGMTKNRTRPWTDAELQTGRGGRGR